MKNLLILSLLLTGCAGGIIKDSYHDSKSEIDKIEQSLGSLEQNLPVECKTQIVQMQISDLKYQVAEAKASVEKVWKAYRAEKRDSFIDTLGLAAILALALTLFLRR